MKTPIYHRPRNCLQLQIPDTVLPIKRSVIFIPYIHTFERNPTTGTEKMKRENVCFNGMQWHWRVV